MTWLTRLSLTNRAIVALVTILVVVLGVTSTISLRQELYLRSTSRWPRWSRSTQARRRR
jgi:hypothetical protein